MFRRKNQKKPDLYGSWHKIRREEIEAPDPADNTEAGAETSEASGTDRITFEEDDSLEQLDTIISNLKQKSQKMQFNEKAASQKDRPGYKEITELASTLVKKLEQCEEKEFASAVSSESLQKLKDMLWDRKETPSESLKSTELNGEKE